jgi:hypothetical protein
MPSSKRSSDAGDRTNELAAIFAVQLPNWWREEVAGRFRRVIAGCKLEGYGLRE